MKVSSKISISEGDLELEFPEPDKALLEGVGETCTWEQCMKDTAAQTIYYLRTYPDPPSILPEERFVLD